MAVINQNNCNITNVQPLTLSCFPNNASNPEATDGSVIVGAFGGNAPYTYEWEGTNNTTNTLTGLGPGDYTVTVTDAYGDFSETITCTVGVDEFYLDRFIKCNDFNPNIYVFYDGTSMAGTEAETASKQIRAWFKDKTDNGFTGNLYEGVVGGSNGITSTDNDSRSVGENWLWWSTYPYLGSLTGGTLSNGDVIEAFGRNGESVENSVYSVAHCVGNDNGKCVPRTVSFNNRGRGTPNTFTNSTNPGYRSNIIYYKINKGLSLDTDDTDLSTPDEVSQGVPFNHAELISPIEIVPSEWDDQSLYLYGDFEGGDKEYIVIIICDEADAFPALYSGSLGTNESPIPQTFKNRLFTKPFEQINPVNNNGTTNYWDDETLTGPSTRFSREYEDFLRVWEDIKSQEGSFDGFLYPVIGSRQGQSTATFLQHAAATIEGDSITEEDFEEKYGAPISEVPTAEIGVLNLSALTRINVYSGLTGTDAYSNLPAEYQNGAGLKNFNWRVDLTAQGYGVLSESIDTYLDSIQLTDEEVYTLALDPTPNEESVNQITAPEDYEGCWYYDERVISGQDYESIVLGDTEYDDCYACTVTEPRPAPQPLYLCLSDGTNQYEFSSSGSNDSGFVWYNEENDLTLSYNESMVRWEVTPWTNVGLGGMVRQVSDIVPTGSFVNVGNLHPQEWNMTLGRCTGIPLGLTAQVSDETCRGTGNGAVILEGSGGYSPYEYRIQNVLPYPDYSVSGIFSNLTPGNYLAEVRDTSGNTTTTVFTLNQGEIGINYVVNLTSSLISSSTGSKTWGYGIQVTPALASGLELNFDLVLTHVRGYRDQGIANFSYTHTISKNGNIPVPYFTSSETTTTVETDCQTKPTNDITVTFTDTANNVTYSSSDTSLNGTVVQTVTIDGQGLSCLPDCRMVGIYNTSLQIQNLSITGSPCVSTTNSFSPTTQNITIYDCQEAQP